MVALPPELEPLLERMEGPSEVPDQVGRLVVDRRVLEVEGPLLVDLVVDRALVVSTLGEGCRTAVELAADPQAAVALEEGCLTAVALEADLQTAVAVADQMVTEDRSSPEVAEAVDHPRRMTC